MKRKTPQPVRTYRSTEGRVEVWRNAPGDFTTFCDGEALFFRSSQAEAEHAGAMWLEEEMRAVARIAPFGFERVEFGAMGV